MGPGLRGRYLLGADQNGRDVMVRLMYGGRTSIYIGVLAAVITTLFAVIIGTLAGYYRGWIDAVLWRLLDVVWAFPVLLLGIALGTTLGLGGFKVGGLVVAGDSLWIPILIIGLVYVPYMARPVRGEILALREKEFVEAAVAQGKGPVRIMVSELLRTSSPRSSCSSPSTSPTTCCWNPRCHSSARACVRRTRPGAR